MKRGIRELWESIAHKHNAEQDSAHRKMAAEEFKTKYMSLLTDKKISWNDVSFKSLWEGLVVSQDLEEDINTSAFPLLTSTLIRTTVMKGYDSVPDFVDQLTTTVQTNASEVVSHGWGPMSDLYEVKEGDEYRQLSYGEKEVRVKPKKYGGLISVTEEAVLQDTTGQILAEATRVGERGKKFKNKLALKAAVDRDANIYDGAELYKSDDANDNYLAGADSALGTTGWENADAKLNQQEDSDDEPIDVQSTKPILMVPPRLKGQALKLKNGDFSGIGTANLDPNIAKDQFDIIVNPYFADYKTTTAWLYGNFKSQFLYAEVWPIQVTNHNGRDTEQGFYRDIIQTVKVRLKGGIGAIDTKFVIKSAGV